MRWLLTIVALGFFLIAAVLAFRSNDRDHEANSLPTVNDPRVAAMVQRPRCPDAEYTYTWICGSVLRMPGPSVSRVCTSEEEPLFAGTLSLPGQSFFFGSSLQLTYALPLGPLVPCSESWPESTHVCTSVVLFPMTTNVFGIFDELPPDPLPTDFPSRPFESTGHKLEPDYFAEFYGNPVALYYTRWIGEKPGAAPDKCLLETRINSLDIGIELSLPCAEMDRWRGELGRMIESIEGGILSSDRSATCGMPPVGSVIPLNKYYRPALESMSLWLDIYR